MKLLTPRSVYVWQMGTVQKKVMNKRKLPIWYWVWNKDALYSTHFTPWDSLRRVLLMS